MDKRFMAHKRVRNKITKSLLALMEEKKFSDITVTDIVTYAQVARATYYRNYTSKEDVLISAFSDVLQTYRTRIRQEGYDFFEYESILLIFRYIRAFRRAVLVTYNAGLASLFLLVLDEHTDVIAGDIGSNDINRYMLPFFAGGLFNVFIKWLENDMKESPEDMARVFHGILHGLIYSE